jgi:cytochrome oxidase Cu insertion factor (SCO1/SenC/PrrC family)
VGAIRPVLERCRWLILGVAVLAVAGVALTVWWTHRAPTDGAAVVYGTVPDFLLVERSGRTIARADLLGKVWVVDFFYTRCTDVCTLQNAHLARLEAELPARADLMFVSVSVDPEYDSPAILSAYAARLHADSHRWLFLTGPRPAIERLAFDGFHLAVPAARREPSSSGSAWIRPAKAWAHGQDAEADADTHALPHAAKFALVDRHGRIRGYFDSTDWSDVERLREALTLLLRRKR